jgi:drug/metabolite transporter (DMT)-like permease
MAIFVKLAGTSLPSFHIGFARSLVQWIIVLVILAVKVMILVAFYSQRIPPFGTRKTLLPLLGRGLCGFIAMSCYYYGLTHSALGEAVVITFTSPISTAILARIVLK